MFSLKLEVDEYPAVVLIVLLHTVIQLLDMSLIEKTQDLLLELPAPFTGYDINKCDLFVKCFFNDAVQFRIDLIALVVNVVQVQF